MNNPTIDKSDQVVSNVSNIYQQLQIYKYLLYMTYDSLKRHQHSCSECDSVSEVLNKLRAECKDQNVNIEFSCFS